MTCKNFSGTDGKYFCKIKGFFSPTEEKVRECLINYKECIIKSNGKFHYENNEGVLSKIEQTEGLELALEGSFSY